MTILGKILAGLVLILIISAAFFYAGPVLRRLPDVPEIGEIPEILKIATSSVKLPAGEVPAPEPEFQTPPPPKKISETTPPAPLVKEVSSKSFEELVNGAVIQLYCGNLTAEKNGFLNVSRGTGIIIDDAGRILTNRHLIQIQNSKETRSDCFVLKSPFPNPASEKPKIYYAAEIVGYPLEELYDPKFSRDKYYNDFAILKIGSRPGSGDKINLMLQTDYAAAADYAVLESNGKFNFLPFDWLYQPKDGDVLITLGYGIDASKSANQITSTVGRLAGNINVAGNSKPQILLIESNATSGFSGGALINPASKGLIGLVSWVSAGTEEGKFTVTIFRDFLRDLTLEELNFDLKSI